jgi:hypothetical protein
MPTDVNMEEVLVAPLATMVREISASVAAAQRDLDATSIDAQARLAQDHPELQALGYQVSWYQIPEATVEMRMALHFEKKQPQAAARMYVAPFNTKYRSTFNFAAEGTSTLKLRIVPVPPPGRAG